MAADSKNFVIILFNIALMWTFSECLFCPDPGHPENGKRTLVDRIEFPTGTIARFSCDSDFSLVGSPKIECLSNGYWNVVTPKCVDHCKSKCQNDATCIADLMGNYRCLCTSQYTGNYCEIRLCVYAPLVQYGDPILISGGQDGSRYTAGSAIQYVCNNHFEIHGSNYLTCGSDGSWSPTPPICRPKRCQNAFNRPSYILQHGNYNPKQADYAFESNVTFHCAAGYELRGSASSYCSISGNWLPSGWPQCEPRRCLPIYSIRNGFHTPRTPNPKVGDVVRYYCNQQYYRWGPALRKCEVTSASTLPRWSHSSPECLSRNEFISRCEAMGQIMSSITLSCIPKRDCPNCKTSPKNESLTIVTAASGAFLAMLLIVVVIVACQRRRLMRRLRRSSNRPRLGSRTSSDQMRFVYYSNDVHFILPSYDEAVRTRSSDPPPFDSAVSHPNVNESQTQRTNNEDGARATSTDTTDEELYESINDSVGIATSHQTRLSTNEQQNNTNAANSQTVTRSIQHNNNGNDDAVIAAGNVSTVEVAQDALRDDDGHIDSNDNVPLLSGN